MDLQSASVAGLQSALLTTDAEDALKELVRRALHRDGSTAALVEGHEALAVLGSDEVVFGPWQDLLLSLGFDRHNLQLGNYPAPARASDVPPLPIEDESLTGPPAGGPDAEQYLFQGSSCKLSADPSPAPPAIAQQIAPVLVMRGRQPLRFDVIAESEHSPLRLLAYDAKGPIPDFPVLTLSLDHAGDLSLQLQAAITRATTPGSEFSWVLAPSGTYLVVKEAGAAKRVGAIFDPPLAAGQVAGVLGAVTAFVSAWIDPSGLCGEVYCVDQASLHFSVEASESRLLLRAILSDVVRARMATGIPEPDAGDETPVSVPE